MRTARRPRQKKSSSRGLLRPSKHSPARTLWLVLGYGNTLRGDDAAGPRVAEAVAALDLPGVRALACHQLTPELAETLAQSERVVFVDAAVDRPLRVRLRPLRPGPPASVGSHFSDPRAVLALARQLFGRAPRAWWLTIPALRFEFGETLSAPTRRGIAEALNRIRALVNAPRSSERRHGRGARQRAFSRTK